MLKQELTRKDLAEFFAQKKEYLDQQSKGKIHSNIYDVLSEFCACLEEEFADQDLSY